MACIEKIYSVSVLVGTNACNGKCKFCAATELRKDAPQKDGIVTPNLESALRLSSKYGGWSLSITSSGEPTLSPESVTNTLALYDKLKSDGVSFPFINLFTNGIKIGKDKIFSEYYLPKWKKFGLTSIAVSVHSINRKEQAAAYGLEEHEYPEWHEIFWAIKHAGLVPRITLLLRKGAIDTPEKFKQAVDFFTVMQKINMITTWEIANADGSSNEFTPSWINLIRIRYWLWKNGKRVMGHVWGGTVYDYKGYSIRITKYVSEHKPDNDFIRQLVVFQDGKVAYSWFQEGAFCLK